MVEDYKILQRLLKGLFPFRKKILLIVLIMLTSTAISFILPLISRYITDQGLLKGNFYLVMRFSLVALALVILDQLINIYQTKLVSYVNNLYSYKWTTLSMRKLMRLRMSYLNKKNFSEIIGNIRMDVNNISAITNHVFIFRILSLFKIVGGFIGLFTIDYRLAIFILIIIPLRYRLTNYFTKLRKDLQNKRMESVRAYSEWYGDKMAGIKEIKMSGIENIIMRQFSQHQRAMMKVDMESQATDSWNRNLEVMLFQTISSFIYITGALMIMKESLSIGGLFAFSTYSMQVITPISSLFEMKYDLAKINLAAKRLFEFLDIDCEGKDCGTVRIKKDDVHGNIKVQDVSFSYDEKTKILKNINFDINKGEKVGIVGLNGSGKSTIINILLKVCQPDSGKILLDGIDISKIKTKDLRKSIAVVNQEMHLFNDSIRDNIALFTKLSDEKLKETLKRSNALPFVVKLPNNIDTKLGVNGSRLSGGEKQRIALARAFAKSCNILVLDEATSNFDLKYEKFINATLMKEMRDKTIILVTHRPYILSELDKIIVVDKGEIAAVGRHEELLIKSDIYAEIISHPA